MNSYGGRYLDDDEVRALGFRSVGRDVMIHSTCVLVGLENITIGNYVRVDPFCTIVAATGKIEIGSHVHIAAYAFLSGGEGITVADFVGISHGVRLLTRNDDYSGQALTGPTIPERYTKIHKGPISIGRHSVIGSGSVVLPAVTVGEGSVVGALSLVRQDLESWGVYAGIPVRRLRDRSQALLQMEQELREVEGVEGSAAQERKRNR